LFETVEIAVHEAVGDWSEDHPEVRMNQEEWTDLFNAMTYHMVTALDPTLLEPGAMDALTEPPKKDEARH
jgi:hypothetical protein